MMKWVPATVVLLLGMGCSLTGPEERFVIQTDSTEYQLRDLGGLFIVDLRVRITNPLDRTVFLHRLCGYGDGPSSRVRRAGGDTTRIVLDQGVCITRPMREPIPLPGGESYVDHVELMSHLSPNANPPITMDMRTGRFVLVYDIQPTDRIGGWDPVNPLPRERTTSNPFVVVAPGDR